MQEHVKASEAAAAEVAYRKALADLIAFETGTAPAWAASPTSSATAVPATTPTLRCEAASGKANGREMRADTPDEQG